MRPENLGNTASPEAVSASECINVASRLKKIKEDLACSVTRLEGLSRFVYDKAVSPDECYKDPECLMDEVELIANYAVKVADYSNWLSELLGAF